MTVIHSIASAQSRVATLHLIVHELHSIFGGLGGNCDASPATGREGAEGREPDVTVAHRK